MKHALETRPYDTASLPIFIAMTFVYALLRRRLFGHLPREPGAGVAASRSNAAGIFRGDVTRLLGLTARIISKTSLTQV